MAREVQIVTWCDYCLSEDEHMAGHEFAGLTLAGVRVVIDLCDRHATDILLPAVKLLETYGRTEAKPKPRAHTKTQTPRTNRKVAAAPGPCPECDREFHSAQSLGMHRWRKHGVPSATRPHKKSAA